MKPVTTTTTTAYLPRVDPRLPLCLGAVYVSLT